jgi:integrase/recombinase XerD
METIRWDLLPHVAQTPPARKWLTVQCDLRLADNTITAYGRGLEDYLLFCDRLGIDPQRANREHVAKYVHDLAHRPSRRGRTVVTLDSGAGLSNATMQQRITVVRLFYDHLMEEALRQDNPVGRGRYTPGKGFGGKRDRGLIPRFRKLPWIPDETQWRAVLTAARAESLRNRFMLALAYDAALRRQELCSLAVGDIDPSHRLIWVRAETTKNRVERVVPYSAATADLYAAYLQERSEVTRDRGPLFRSFSYRNRAAPISPWTWSKAVQAIALRADVPQFTTHTPRHLCLTDLARAGWDIHEIATFAGHRNVQTTLLYIHLSGRDLAAKLARGMAEMHAWRTADTAEALQ